MVIKLKQKELSRLDEFLEKTNAFLLWTGEFVMSSLEDIKHFCGAINIHHVIK